MPFHIAVPILLLMLTVGCSQATEPGPFSEGGHLVSGGPPPDGIAALNNPPRISGSEMTPDVLGYSDHVIGVVRNGEAVAYPVKVLDWREVANDVVGGDPVVVSYCPLTATGIGFTRETSSGTVQFGVSGLLCDSNLVMFDRTTQSLWPQMTWEAVRGPMEGESLEQIQVLETDWGTWQGLHPDTQVLDITTMESRSAYDYDVYPYGNYYEGSLVRFPLRNRDERLFSKERVHGVRVGSARRVYKLSDLGASTAVNDTLGGRPIVVFGSSSWDFAAAFHREVDGEVRAFRVSGADPTWMEDEETGTVWNVHGEALSGPDAGKQLESAAGFTGFWFAWASFEPDIEIWQPPAPGQR